MRISYLVYFMIIDIYLTETANSSIDTMRKYNSESVISSLKCGDPISMSKTNKAQHMDIILHIMPDNILKYILSIVLIRSKVFIVLLDPNPTIN